MQIVYDFLEKYGLAYERYDHPAVYTCEEAEKHCGHILGLDCKNLFLRDKKKTRFFLYVAPADKRVDLKAFAKHVWCSKLSFGSPALLMEKLWLEPWSVSPFGMLSDDEQLVELCVDKDVYDADVVWFHPNVNTATLTLERGVFHTFLEMTQREFIVVDL